MEPVIERRASRRFTMMLPLTIRSVGSPAEPEKRASTKDISFRGLYFFTEAEYQTGARIEFVLTLPREISHAGDVNIRCQGEVVRVEAQSGSRGVAARIERYEFVPAAV